jgi:hypothetical protein
MADLELLVDYVAGLHSGLERAERHTKEGELGLAVWSYLEVLEVDPDNSAARRQVGQVATAVRQFDRVAQGRRWHNGLGDASDSAGARLLVVVRIGFVILLAIVIFLLGYGFGSRSPVEPTPTSREILEPKLQQLGG